MTKKTLTLDKSILSAILWAGVIAVVVVVVIQHFGTFYGYAPHKYTTSFTSPLGFKHSFKAQLYPKEYLDELTLYIKITFSNFKYILYFWAPISCVSILLQKVNIKIK